MFFYNQDAAFKITGVFYVERLNAKEGFATMRKHTAISYRIKGDSEFHCEDKKIKASTGSVTYIPANIDYKQIRGNESLIIVHLQGFGEIGSDIEVIDSCEELEPLFRNLLYAWETKKSYNCSMQLLYSIFEALQNIKQNRLQNIPDIIKPGIEYLQKNYKIPQLRITDVADSCFISEVYFRKLFKNYFGKTPQEALEELRFSSACELLSSGYFSQKEAARFSGFSDVKYFRTSFKKHYGITPSEYIKSHNNFKKISTTVAEFNDFNTLL